MTNPATGGTSTKDVTVAVTYVITNSVFQNITAATALRPASTTGDAQVFIEVSTDLDTWTPVQPGLFQSAAQDRFFRTAVRPNSTDD